MMILVKKGFISSNFHDHLFALPTFCGLFLIRKGAKGELSYKAKKDIFIMNMPSESSDEQIRTADTTGMNRML